MGLTGIILGWQSIKKHSIIFSCICGMLWGFAYLTRPEGIGFLMVFSSINILIFFYSFFGNSRRWKNLLISFSSVVVFLIVAFPYLNFLHDHTGEWTLSSKMKALQQGEALTIAGKVQNRFRILNDENTTVPIDQIYHLGNFVKSQKEEKITYIKISPILILKKYSTNFYRTIKYGVPRVFTLLFLILFGLGLFGEKWKKEELFQNLYVLSFVGFFWFIVVPMFHINDRYYLPLLPITFIWIGKGTLFLKNRLTQILNHFSFSKGLSFLNLRWILTISLILGFSYLPELGKIISRDKWSTNKWDDPVEQQIAAQWLREQVKNPPIIMTRNHAIDFYVGSYDIKKSVTIPFNSVDRILKYAEHRNVEYILLSERFIIDYPQIEYLLNDPKEYNCLHLIYLNEDREGLKTVIYKFAPHKDEI